MTFYNRIEHPVYFNDFDEGACAWIAELMKQGHIPPRDAAAGYGNAINPHAAALFIQAFMEAADACEQVPDLSLDGLIV